MRRKRQVRSDTKIVYSEDFTDSSGLMIAILNARSKLYCEGENLESVGISGRLTLKRRSNDGYYTMTLTARS